VAIIGAGPVGCVAALTFAREGARVLLLEANPRASERLAGEWLHPPAVDILRGLDIPVASSEHHAIGLGFVVFPDDGTEPVVLPYAQGTAGISCDHLALVQQLRKRVLEEQGVTYLEPARVSAIEGQHIQYYRNGGPLQSTSARLIVGAMGRSSVPGERSGSRSRAKSFTRMGGIMLRNAQLPFEGFGHLILGGPGPILAYRLSPDRIRVCLDVPPGLQARSNPGSALWEAFSSVMPEALRRSFRAALEEGPILWASNPIQPREDYGRDGFSLVGDAVGYHHPLTALGLTAGFQDALALARSQSFSVYRRRRSAESRVPEMLAVSLYEILAGTTTEALAMRRALYQLWRRQPEERVKTMQFLASQDTSPVRFGKSFLKVAISAWGTSVREGLESRRLDRTRTISKGLAGRVRWLLEASVRKMKPLRHGGAAPQRSSRSGETREAVASVQARTPSEETPCPGDFPPSGADPRAALVKGARHLAGLQKPDGSWEGEVVWCPMLAAQYVLMCAITGTPIEPVRKRRLLQHFEQTRLPCGSWGLHELSPPYLFVTALVYVAARLLGIGKDDPLLTPAGDFMRSEGGVVSIPTWGKFWLAMLNLYSWEGVNPVLPEIWRLPVRFPLHPSKYYCHTRLIYLGMASIYGRKFQAPLTPLIQALREELYPDGYDRVAPEQARRSLRSGDVFSPPGRVLRFANRLLKFADRFHGRKFRAQTLSRLREHIRHEFRTTDYTCISPVSGLLNIIALWISDPRDKDLRAALARFDGWIWEDDDQGARVAGARSASWDTAFGLQALNAAARHADVQHAREQGAAFLRSQQIRLPLKRAAEFHRNDPTGGYCFAGIWHGWPVSDCTAEALIARLESPDGEGDQQSLVEAVGFILRCQNQDEGFGSYEARRVELRLDWLNPAEMFGDCMTEGSYVECTASCVSALAAFRKRHPDALRDRVSRAVRGAERRLRVIQLADGSWPANWGVHFIYGTMFGVRGLIAAGVPTSDPAIRRACAWILKRQRADGGWGEHHSSCLTGVYAEHPQSQIIQTAWAMLTLLEARDPDWEPLHQAARFLAAAQSPAGDWPRQDPAGVFFHTALLDYTLYRRYFPVWALGLYETRVQTELPRSRGSRVLPRPEERAGVLSQASDDP
jgi:lanosterol synthase